MVATVMEKIKKPYKLDNGKSGVSCRISLFLGSYDSDSLTETVGEGEQFIEVRCPEKLADLNFIIHCIYSLKSYGYNRIIL